MTEVMRDDWREWMEEDGDGAGDALDRLIATSTDMRIGLEEPRTRSPSADALQRPGGLEGVCITEERMRKRFFDQNRRNTDARTPHATKMHAGPHGNVYDWVVINVPLHYLEEEATTFGDIKKSGSDQLFFRAWVFLWHALYMRGQGSCGARDCTFIRDGVPTPKFIIKAELLVKRLYDEDDPTQTLPLVQLLATENRAGLRFHIYVMDPKFSIDAACVALMKANAMKNRHPEYCIADLRMQYEDDGVENPDRDKMFCKQVASIQKRCVMDSRRLKEKLSLSSVRGSQFGALPKALVARRIELAYKRIHRVDQFAHLVVYPLTQAPAVYTAVKRRNLTIGDISAAGDNQLCCSQWGRFSTALNVLLFRRDGGGDDGGGEDGSGGAGQLATEVCESQMMLSGYKDSSGGDGAIVFGFPCDDLVCEYEPHQFGPYSVMKDRSLPFAVSMFDVALGMLRGAHAAAAAELRRKRWNPDSDACRRLVSMDGLMRAGGRADTRVGPAVAYTQFGSNELASHVMATPGAEERQREEDRSVGGDLLVEYNHMREQRRKLGWVARCVPREYPGMYTLMTREGMRRFLKLTREDADVSSSMAYTMAWYRQRAAEADWGAIYATVPSLDPTKGRYVSMAAKELEWYETFCLLSAQHTIMAACLSAILFGQQYYRFREDIGEGTLGRNIMMTGGASVGKSHIMQCLRSALISGTISKTDASTDNSKLGVYNHGEVEMSDEMSACLAVSGSRNISAEKQHTINLVKTMLTENQLRKDYMEIGQSADGRSYRITRQDIKDKQVVLITASNVDYGEAALMTRFDKRDMGTVSRPGKDLASLASERLNDQDVELRQNTLYRWARSLQFLTTVAGKMQALGALPPCDIEIVKVYFKRAMEALRRVNPEMTRDIRFSERLYGHAMEITMRGAIDAVFHSELSPGVEQLPDGTTRVKPFEFDDVRRIAPYMCMREDAAIGVVMEGVAELFPAHEHELVCWIAVTLCGYRLPLQPYLDEEFVRYMEGMYGVGVFRDPLVMPSVIEGHGHSLVKQSVYVGGRAGFCFKSLALNISAGDLAKKIAIEKKSGTVFTARMIKHILWKLGARTMRTEAMVFATDKTDGGAGGSDVVGGERMHVIGSCDVQMPIISCCEGSGVQGSRVQISIAFLDRTVRYYQQKVLSHIMHAKIRQGGTLLTDMGLDALAQAEVARVREACADAETAAASLCDRSVWSSGAVDRDAMQLAQYSSSAEGLRNSIASISASIGSASTVASDLARELREKRARLELVTRKAAALAESSKAEEERCARTGQQVDAACRRFSGCMRQARQALECLADAPNVATLASCYRQAREALRRLEACVLPTSESSFKIKRMQDACSSVERMAEALQRCGVGPRRSLHTFAKEVMTQRMLANGEALWCDAADETPTVMAAARTRMHEGRLQVLRVRRKVPSGSTHPLFPYIMEMRPVEAGSFVMNVPNASFMNPATYSDISGVNNLDFMPENAANPTRLHPTLAYDCDVEKRFHSEHLTRIGIPPDQHAAFYFHNFDDHVLIHAENSACHRSEYGDGSLHDARVDYPAAYIEKERRIVEGMELENRKAQLANGDPDMLDRAAYIRSGMFDPASITPDDVAFSNMNAPRRSRALRARDGGADSDSGMMASGEGSEDDAARMRIREALHFRNELIKRKQAPARSFEKPQKKRRSGRALPPLVFEVLD